MTPTPDQARAEQRIRELEPLCGGFSAGDRMFIIGLMDLLRLDGPQAIEQYQRDRVAKMHKEHCCERER